MDEKIMARASSTILFLDQDLELPIEDRKDPLVLMFLIQIEQAELYHGDGLVWYKRFKNNYGLRFGNADVEKRMEYILLNNTERSIDKK